MVFCEIEFVDRNNPIFSLDVGAYTWRIIGRYRTAGSSKLELHRPSPSLSNFLPRFFPTCRSLAHFLYIVILDPSSASAIASPLQTAFNHISSNLILPKVRFPFPNSYTPRDSPLPSFKASHPRPFQSTARREPLRTEDQREKKKKTRSSPSPARSKTRSSHTFSPSAAMTLSLSRPHRTHAQKQPHTIRLRILTYPPSSTPTPFPLQEHEVAREANWKRNGLKTAAYRTPDWKPRTRTHASGSVVAVSRKTWQSGNLRKPNGRFEVGVPEEVGFPSPHERCIPDELIPRTVLNWRDGEWRKCR